MSFRNRLFFFVFGIFIGIFFIRFIFSPEKISKIKEGYSSYFKGHDKVVNFLLNQDDFRRELESNLSLKILITFLFLGELRRGC